MASTQGQALDKREMRYERRKLGAADASSRAAVAASAAAAAVAVTKAAAARAAAKVRRRAGRSAEEAADVSSNGASSDGNGAQPTVKRCGCCSACILQQLDCPLKCLCIAPSTIVGLWELVPRRGTSAQSVGMLGSHASASLLSPEDYAYDSGQIECRCEHAVG